MTKVITGFLVTLTALQAHAQDLTVVSEKAKTWVESLDSTTIILLLFAAVVLLLTFATILVALNVVLSLLNAENRRKGLPEIDLFGDFKKKFITGDVLPIERSSEIQLDHNYDGIVELDNTMPPWLRAVFGVTIAIAVGYLGFYYVLDAGKFQQQEYEEEMAIAAVEREAYQKKADNAINEDNVSLTTEPALLASAKEVFATNCKTCHGANGEGGAGPNLTDAYWLHGNDVKDIFKTIKYGIPEKGMISWQQKLTPKDMQGLSSYILSIQGTNPAGAKAPQGVLINAVQVKTEVDTLAVSSAKNTK